MYKTLVQQKLQIQLYNNKIFFIMNKQQNTRVEQRIQVKLQQMHTNKPKLTIYDGLTSKVVNLAAVESTRVFTPVEVLFEADSDAKMNALKYRYPLKYLGSEYNDIVVPCTPAYQLSLRPKQTFSKENSQLFYFVKVPAETGVTGIASGKRSAIYLNKDGKLFRFKGCGNQYKGFNKQNNQSRGHHFFHTAKRQMFSTQHINSVMKKSLGIDPPANKPLYAFKFSESSLEKTNTLNQLSLISKYCCVFETQGDRRAGTHLISPLQILFLEFVDHENAAWKSIFEQKQRIDNNQIIELVANYELFVDSNNKFLNVYDSSKQISTYISFDNEKLKIASDHQNRLQNIVKKLISQQEHQNNVMKLIKKIQPQEFIRTVEVILKRIGFQMGQIKRVMCENEISWGFYLDHGVQWHCNAHLNNFIITRPRNTQQSKNFFLLPLDYDLSYSSEEFICIDIDSPHYGKFSDEVFQNYLCGQFCAMEMSLFGLELMNFKYGINQSESNNEDRKMSRVSFRDTLVNAFNCGMRNKTELIQQINKNWNQNIENIKNLVQACLFLSNQFQT